MSEIALQLVQQSSRVTREVTASCGRYEYGVRPAHVRAYAATLRPKTAKLDRGPLCETVTPW